MLVHINRGCTTNDKEPNTERVNVGVPKEGKTKVSTLKSTVKWQRYSGMNKSANMYGIYLYIYICVCECAPMTLSFC